ncbi:hypothetical protein CsSME_00004776 [Camellia sinensis var. sinensis]
MKILTSLLVRLRGYFWLVRSELSEVGGSVVGAETTGGGKALRRRTKSRSRWERMRGGNRLMGVSGDGLMRRGGTRRRGNKLMGNSKDVLIRRDLRRK